MKKTIKFGAFLKSERKRLGLTQQELVQKMGGRGITNYALYETGQRHPHDMSMWSDLTKVYGWSVQNSAKYWEQMMDEAYPQRKDK